MTRSIHSWYLEERKSFVHEAEKGLRPYLSGQDLCHTAEDVATDCQRTWATKGNAPATLEGRLKYVYVSARRRGAKMCKARRLQNAQSLSGSGADGDDSNWEIADAKSRTPVAEASSNEFVERICSDSQKACRDNVDRIILQRQFEIGGLSSKAARGDGTIQLKPDCRRQRMRRMRQRLKRDLSAELLW